MRPAASRGRYFPRRSTRRRSRARRYAEYALTLAIFLLLAVVAARLDRVQTITANGNAVVNDGDTITIGTERIRLRGIDAPEYDQTCTKAKAGYACGHQATQALQALIAGRRVSCPGWERDKYDRLLAVCTSGGVELNRRLVEQGWAVAYGDYSDAEAMARRSRVGLWAGEFDRPRDWREKKGDLADGEHDTLALALNWLRQLFSWR